MGFSLRKKTKEKQISFHSVESILKRMEENEHMAQKYLTASEAACENGNIIRAERYRDLATSLLDTNKVLAQQLIEIKNKK